MKKIVALLLVMALVSPIASAQGLMASVDREAARLAAESRQDSDQAMIMGMNRTYFGLGLGFLAGGGGAMALFAVAGKEDCTYYSNGYEFVERIIPTWWYVAAAGSMGAGVAIWLVGNGKAKKAAELTPVFVPIRGGWVLQKHVRF